MPLNWYCFCGRPTTSDNAALRNTPLERKMNLAVSIVYNNVVQAFPTQPLPINNPGKSYYQGMLKFGLAKLRNRRDNIYIALKYCTESISLFPIESSELSHVFGFRAELLWDLKNYIYSSTDANRCFRMFNQNREVREKARSRKNACQLEINKILEQSRKNIANYTSRNLPEEELSELLYEEDLIQKRLQTERYGICAKFKLIFPLPEANLQNEILPNASHKIRIGQSPRLGRHIVATQNIEPGEILIIEKPYVHSILMRYSGTHCSNCLLRIPALIPCKTCSVVMYCGEECLNDAFERYHRCECPVLTLMTINKIKFDYSLMLSLRFFLVATKQGTALRSLFDDPVFRSPCCREKNFNFDRPYSFDDYFNIHNLEDKYEVRENSEWHQYAANAAFLLYYLKKTSFFEDIQNDINREELTDLERYAGALILKYSFCAQINAHEINECTFTRDRTKHVNIGAGIYPVFHFANHSCDENTRKVYHKNCMVVRAIRPIVAGEEITDNYGTQYTRAKRHKRKKYLKQYHFECQCDPCRNPEQWSLLNQLPFQNPEYLLANPEEGALVEMYTRFRNRPKGCSDNYIQFLCAYLSLLYRNIKKPWLEHCLCENELLNALQKRGNYYDIKYKDVILESAIRM